MNFYNRMVDEMTKTMEMIEGKTVIEFLDYQYEIHAGLMTDIWALESLVQTMYVDLNIPEGFAGDPFKYKANAVQFALRGLIFRITDAVKLDRLSFIIAGNPMATQLIEEWTTWKHEQGSSIGGILVNNSYGFANNMGGNVRIVASNQYEAYTEEPITLVQLPPGGPSPLVPTNQRELMLRIYVYPTSPEHISFRHLKYTSHLLNSQNQTAYQHINRPGGAYNVVTGMSRFRDIVVQGIQARLIMLNSTNVYNAAPAPLRNRKPTMVDDGAGNMIPQEATHPTFRP
jgi:hypothetical protein